jgi:uncharacterized protein (TIGR03085 family)
VAAVTTSAIDERRAMAALLRELGPDAPTLCEGWTARDLAAHLVVRERRPDAAAGIVARPLAKYSERVRAKTGDRDFDELVAAVAEGPPAWSPMHIEAVDRVANTVEMFVHHEDLRRAQPGWKPRELSPALEDELWQRLRSMGRLLFRKVDVGVTLVRPNGVSAQVRRATPVVTVTGPPSELVLFAYGRGTHADVRLDGAPEAVERLRAAPLGI